MEALAGGDFILGEVDGAVAVDVYTLRIRTRLEQGQEDPALPEPGREMECGLLIAVGQGEIGVTLSDEKQGLLDVASGDLQQEIGLLSFTLILQSLLLSLLCGLQSFTLSIQTSFSSRGCKQLFTNIPIKWQGVIVVDEVLVDGWDPDGGGKGPPVPPHVLVQGAALFNEEAEAFEVAEFGGESGRFCVQGAALHQ